MVSHIEVFPEGQLVVSDQTGRILGSASSLLIDWDDYAESARWPAITGQGTFDTHDPPGKTLYGADIGVVPEALRQGIGTLLYEARKRRDPALTFQLENGLVVLDVVPNYMQDTESRGFATVLEWLNPEYTSSFEFFVRSAPPARRERLRSGFPAWVPRAGGQEARFGHVSNFSDHYIGRVDATVRDTRPLSGDEGRRLLAEQLDELDDFRLGVADDSAQQRFLMLRPDK